MPIDPSPVTEPSIDPVADPMGDTVGGSVVEAAPVVEDTAGKVIGDIAGALEDF